MCRTELPTRKWAKLRPWGQRWSTLGLYNNFSMNMTLFRLLFSAGCHPRQSPTVTLQTQSHLTPPTHQMKAAMSHWAQRNRSCWTSLRGLTGTEAVSVQTTERHLCVKAADVFSELLTKTWQRHRITLALRASKWSVASLPHQVTSAGAEQ